MSLLDRAVLKVTEEVAGLRVSGVTSRVTGEDGVGATSQLTDIFVQQFRQDVRGRVVEKCARFALVGADSLAIVLSAIVEKDDEDPSPGFVGDVKIGQDSYREQDKITLTVRSTEMARVYLFAVGRDGSATMFFPNQYDTLNVLHPNDELDLPRRGRPYELVAQLDPRFGAPQPEHVLAIFYNGPGTAPFQAGDAFRPLAMEDLNNKLLSMRRSQWTQTAKGYSITRRAP